MRQASKRVPGSAEKTVRDIRRATRPASSAEEKTRSAELNVLAGFFAMLMASISLVADVPTSAE